MIDEVLIGKIIQKYRKQQELTQEELAEKVNISTNYLSKIERGLNVPNVVTFLKMAEILNFSLQDFGVEFSSNNFKKPAQNELLNFIYSAPDKKIEKYLKIIKCVDEIIL